MQLQYKGLIARYQYAVDAGVYVGEIINVEDVVVFSADTLETLYESMREAVEDYLLLC